MDDPRLYMRVATQLRDEIQAGEYSPGKPLAFVADLTARFCCSRQTAGHALHVLAGEGLIVRFPGRGWYVQDPLPPEFP